MKGYFVVEVSLPSDIDLDTIRKVIADTIRTGDGLYVEDSRLFLVLADAGMSEAVAVVARLNGKLSGFGAEVVALPVGHDALTDSLYRRAEASILPVQPRAPE
ncbi:MAG: hypothetical protein ABIS18_03170 [Actinomycetota bacterium]